MFDPVDFCFEGTEGVVRSDVDFFYNDGLTFVDFFNDIMDHDARFSHLALFESFPRSVNCVCAVEGSRESWMEIYDGYPCCFHRS